MLKRFKDFLIAHNALELYCKGLEREGLLQNRGQISSSNWIVAAFVWDHFPEIKWTRLDDEWFSIWYRNDTFYNPLYFTDILTYLKESSPPISIF